MAQRRGAAKGWRAWVDRVPRWAVALSALLVLACLVGFWAWGRQGTSFAVERGSGNNPQVRNESLVEGEDESFEQYQQSSINTEVPSSTQVEEPQVSRIIVDVDGAVRSPGVYELEGEGVRVRDAVAAAGGLAEDADTVRVNLAATVEDGAKVYVPHVGDEDIPSIVDTVSASGDQGGASFGAIADGRVNINTATSEELQRLPGVGEATADAILRDREANGPFATPEDIMRVSGIGERKFEKMRDLLCV